LLIPTAFLQSRVAGKGPLADKTDDCAARHSLRAVGLDVTHRATALPAGFGDLRHCRPTAYRQTRVIRRARRPARTRCPDRSQDNRLKKRLPSSSTCEGALQPECVGEPAQNAPKALHFLCPSDESYAGSPTLDTPQAACSAEDDEILGFRAIAPGRSLWRARRQVTHRLEQGGWFLRRRLM
jgi:hypothetical protein